MAKTAVVNPRRRRRRRKNPAKARRSAPRRRNPSSEREPNRRRRRAKRRVYGGRRRRNGGSSISRTRNSAVGFNGLIDILPAATAGVVGARWALNQAGEWKDGEPGIPQAIALWLWASFGSEIIGGVLGEGKGYLAKISSLGYAGDMFLRKRFMKENEFLKAQTLGEDPVDRYSQGRDYTDMGAASMVDALGNKYIQTDSGWALGDPDEGVIYVDENGQPFMLGGFENQSPLAGFENQSPLAGFGRVRGGGAFGSARPSHDSSFGYAAA